MSERSAEATLNGLLEALRPLVVELVDEELRGRLDELTGPDWLTLEQAAERYQSTPDALRKRAQRNRLPGAVKDGAHWLVDRRELDAALGDTMTRTLTKVGSRRANGRARGTRRV
ncbi:hypothetical protein [Gaiella sp.]|uniref:hypothetical protein n=1 Tax=Gaiella sp. TaxID=2663207 RepID=UPI002E37532D|nr:hypothetical protein [Gaiella sp.]HEX5582514.1 hypothetical protein [Gaiella sp.]